VLRRFVSAAVVAAGCSSTPTGTIQIVTGGETDTFTRSPAPTKLVVNSIDPSGQSHTLASVALPASTVDLGSQDVNGSGILEVSGFAANGTLLVYGQTLGLQFGALDGVTVPVFVQRTGEFARMPAPLSDSRQAPLLAVVGGRYLVVAGGADAALATSVQIYDVANYSALSSLPTMPRTPESLAVSGTVLWLIDGDGATQYDLSSDAFSDVMPPQGGSFAEVAGGATVSATDGSQYVVGATRTTGATTARVLAIDPAGNPSWLTLAAARLGAAATWSPGRGLVVAGGSATAPGVEVIASGSTMGAPLAYPPDPSTGAGATSLLDSEHVLLAGGVGPAQADAGVRAIDLACGSPCSPVVWSALPAPLAAAEAFAIDPANAVVIGVDQVAQEAVAYRLTTATVTPLAPKIPHPGGRAVASPWGRPGSAILFGGASAIEAFAP